MQRLPQPLSGPRAWCIVRARETRSRRALLRTETLFRELNEAVQLYYRADGHSQADFVCECSDAHCVDPVQLTPTEYTDVRSHATRFFVVPGHEMDEIERVVETNDRFVVVQKPVVP